MPQPMKAFGLPDILAEYMSPVATLPSKSMVSGAGRYEPPAATPPTNARLAPNNTCLNFISFSLPSF